MPRNSRPTACAGLRTAPARLLANRLLADRRGVVAVEFAFVSIALMMMVMGIVHIGYCLYVQSALDQAAAMVAIQVETTGSDPNGTGFAASTICPPMSGLLDCSKVRMSLYPVADFRTLVAPPTNSSGTNRSLMMLTLSYDVPIPTWPVLSLTGGSAFTVVSRVPFVNEY